MFCNIRDLPHEKKKKMKEKRKKNTYVHEILQPQLFHSTDFDSVSNGSIHSIMLLKALLLFHD